MRASGLPIRSAAEAREMRREVARTEDAKSSARKRQSVDNTLWLVYREAINPTWRESCVLHPCTTHKAAE